LARWQDSVTVWQYAVTWLTEGIQRDDSRHWKKPVFPAPLCHPVRIAVLCGVDTALF
jgi:hypothetical protein